MKKTSLSAVAAALALAGCVSVPSGPSTMALPGTGKPFDLFQADAGILEIMAHTIGVAFE